MKQHFLPLLTAMMLLFASIGYTKAQTPLITITTLDGADYEGSISFSLTGTEEEFETVQIDAGYGKKPANHVDSEGNIPLKGNTIKIYGTFGGFVAPMDRVKDVKFTENQCLKNLSFVLNDLPNGLDLSANKALEYVSFMSCGIESLNFDKLPPSLKRLHLSTNNLKEVDLSKLPLLEAIYLDENPQIKTIDFSKNTHLSRINISSNPLITNVNLESNKKLSIFEAWNCNLTDIDLSHTDVLESLSVNNNKLKELKLGKTDKLQILNISGNNIKTLHTEQMPSLQDLSIVKNIEMSSLNLTKCPELRALSIDTTQIRELDLSHCPHLEVLSVSKTRLESLDLSKNELLSQLSIEDCGSFTSLDISNKPLLQILIIAGNKLGFEETKKMVNSLPDYSGTEKMGIWGVFLDKTPEDLNRIAPESVRIAVNKGWEVVARNAQGEFSDYAGFGTDLKEITRQPKGVLNVSKEGNTIEIGNLPQGSHKRVNVLAENGSLIATAITNDSSIRFDGLTHLQGVFIVECNGAVGKGLFR